VWEREREREWERVSKETYYSVKRDLLQGQKRPPSEAVWPDRALCLQCKKRPTIGSKETYYRVKRDLSGTLRGGVTREGVGDRALSFSLLDCHTSESRTQCVRESRYPFHFLIVINVLKLSTLCYAHAAPRQPWLLSDYTLMYAHIGRLAIPHISSVWFICTWEKKKRGCIYFRIPGTAGLKRTFE